MSSTSDFAQRIFDKGADRATFQPALLQAMQDDGLTAEQSIRVYDHADEEAHADGWAAIADAAAELVYLITGKR